MGDTWAREASREITAIAAQRIVKEPVTTINDQSHLERNHGRIERKTLPHRYNRILAEITVGWGIRTIREICGFLQSSKIKDFGAEFAVYPAVVDYCGKQLQTRHVPCELRRAEAHRVIKPNSASNSTLPH